MNGREAQPGLSIFVIVNNAVDNKRLMFAGALRASGHRIHVCNQADFAGIEAELEAFANGQTVDLILTFSWSFIYSGGADFRVPAFKAFWSKVTTPVVVMWDDNPLRWRKIVLGAARVHPRTVHFVIDSAVVDRLRNAGVNARYFPIYYVDPGYMTKERLEFTPDVDVLLCGNVADTDQFIGLLPDPSDVRHQAARKFVELKSDTEAYVDEAQFVADESLDLNVIEQPHFMAILTGIQRTIDRTRILRRIPQGIRVGLIGHNLSAPEIPAHVTRYPGVSHAAIGHVYALPIPQFGTSGWPAACNLRLFQAASMGGIMLHEDRPDARRHFSPEADGLFYSGTDHLVSLMEDALIHRETYASAAAGTRDRFYAEHTVMHRARQFVELLRRA